LVLAADCHVANLLLLIMHGDVTQGGFDQIRYSFPPDLYIRPDQFCDVALICERHQRGEHTAHRTFWTDL